VLLQKDSGRARSIDVRGYIGLLRTTPTVIYADITALTTT